MKLLAILLFIKIKVTMENALKKKFDLRKIFKDVVVKCLEEARDAMEQEVTEERLDMLTSYHETSPRILELSAIKTCKMKF